jgi:hypothetical protein
MFKIYIPNQKLKEIESFLNKHQYKYTSHKELSAHRFVIKLNKSY